MHVLVNAITIVNLVPHDFFLLLLFNAMVNLKLH